MGNDLKRSMLIIFNKVKDTGIIPSFMRFSNIHAIYNDRGLVNELDLERGIFIVSMFRYILMRLIYKEKYSIIDENMSNSNIGARKKMNIWNHIYVVNSIIHNVLSKNTKDPINIMV